MTSLNDLNIPWAKIASVVTIVSVFSGGLLTSISLASDYLNTRFIRISDHNKVRVETVRKIESVESRYLRSNAMISHQILEIQKTSTEDFIYTIQYKIEKNVATDVDRFKLKQYKRRLSDINRKMDKNEKAQLTY
jgi:hypothetical protein